VDQAQIQELWKALFNERGPEKLRDAVRNLNQILQERIDSLEGQPLQSRTKGLIYERAPALLSFDMLSLPNTAKSMGLR
jgi:hypothetical protein